MVASSTSRHAIREESGQKSERETGLRIARPLPDGVNVPGGFFDITNGNGPTARDFFRHRPAAARHFIAPAARPLLSG